MGALERAGQREYASPSQRQALQDGHGYQQLLPLQHLNQDYCVASSPKFNNFGYFVLEAVTPYTLVNLIWSVAASPIYFASLKWFVATSPYILYLLFRYVGKWTLWLLRPPPYICHVLISIYLLSYAHVMYSRALGLQWSPKQGPYSVHYKNWFINKSLAAQQPKN